jgi:hypothetical protein
MSRPGHKRLADMPMLRQDGQRYHAGGVEWWQPAAASSSTTTGFFSSAAPSASASVLDDDVVEAKHNGVWRRKSNALGPVWWSWMVRADDVPVAGDVQVPESVLFSMCSVTIRLALRYHSATATQPTICSVVLGLPLIPSPKPLLHILHPS